MGMVSADVAARNWRTGMANSSEKLKQGINGVTESPTAKAARAIDRQVQGVARAAAEGRTQAALNAVSIEDWKAAMLTKGVPRVAAGAAAAEPKMAMFMSEFLPHLQAGVNKLASMPRGDLESNIARATEMMRHNAQFRRRRL